MSNLPLAQEVPPPGEAACIQDLAERLKAKIIRDNPTGIMRRDAHPKMHGVVKAEFTVKSGLPDALRVGIFKEPHTFRAWIRFSNQDGSINPDIDRDLRGMAIKLMGVPGEKLLEQELQEQTQDFILISSNVFVTDNYLREAMIKQLAQHDVVFDFAVQLQIDADAMPIENPSKAWSEVLSPFRKVATIRILRQEFDSEAQREFGENLSYSPWHSLPEHRPLGGINRARKVVYQFISLFRHQQNNAPRKEPTGWDIEQT